MTEMNEIFYVVELFGNPPWFSDSEERNRLYKCHFKIFMRNKNFRVVVAVVVFRNTLARQNEQLELMSNVFLSSTLLRSCFHSMPWGTIFLTYRVG